jgi:hypothetical protein
MEPALEKFQEIGITEMVSRTISSVKDFPSETVYAGFSNEEHRLSYLLEQNLVPRDVFYFTLLYLLI